MMEKFIRWLHKLRGRHYFRLAARMQRDLHEHVLVEENRIAVCLHRAAWHRSQGDQSLHQKPATYLLENHTTRLPSRQNTAISSEKPTEG